MATVFDVESHMPSCMIRWRRETRRGGHKPDQGAGLEPTRSGKPALGEAGPGPLRQKRPRRLARARPALGRPGRYGGTPRGGRSTAGDEARAKSTEKMGSIPPLGATHVSREGILVMGSGGAGGGANEHFLLQQSKKHINVFPCFEKVFGCTPCPPTWPALAAGVEVGVQAGPKARPRAQPHPCPPPWAEAGVQAGFVARLQAQPHPLPSSLLSGQKLACKPARERDRGLNSTLIFSRPSRAEVGMQAGSEARPRAQPHPCLPSGFASERWHAGRLGGTTAGSTLP